MAYVFQLFTDKEGRSTYGGAAGDIDSDTRELLEAFSKESVFNLGHNDAHQILEEAQQRLRRV